MAQLHTHIGRCIYCGAGDSPLTREHVLPRGLGGNQAPEEFTDALVLQKASCEACQRIIQQIEQDCLRTLFVHPRERLGLRRTGRQKQEPLKIKAELVYPNGASEERHLDPYLVHAPIALPRFQTAGALTNEAITSSDAPFDYEFLLPFPSVPAAFEGSAKIGVSLTIDPKPFMRMLAKIALGYAVFRLGLDGFTPCLQDFILSEDRQGEYGHWLGGLKKELEAPTDSLHTISLRTIDAAVGPLHIVDVRLFAEFGGPTNYAVVGKPL